MVGGVEHDDVIEIRLESCGRVADQLREALHGHESTVLDLRDQGHRTFLVAHQEYGTADNIQKSIISDFPSSAWSP